MDSLDNKLPEDKYEEKWFRTLIFDTFLFTLSLLVVLQTFSVVYRMTKIISSLYVLYAKPLEVVRESDLDPFDDIHEEDEEESDTKDRIVDLILEFVNFSMAWIGLAAALDLWEDMLLLIIFTISESFLVLGSLMRNSITFWRKKIDFYDRIENFSIYLLIFWQFFATILAIITLSYKVIEHIGKHLQ